MISKENFSCRIGAYEFILPADRIGNAINKIYESLNSGGITSRGIASSLVSILENAVNSLNQGNEIAAKNMLQSFINHVDAQAGKKITEETATYLINAISQAIIGM